jgi:hypothetical protein
MNKLTVFLALTFVLTARLAVAEEITDQGWGYANEIAQQWVDRHNEKLPDLVKKSAQLIFPRKHGLVVSSLRVPQLAKKALKLDTAGDYGIPAQVVNAQGVTVGLVELHRTLVHFAPGGEHVFLTAEYYDELTPLHSSSNIYMKIGHSYFQFFHGEGYPHSAKILWLDHTEKEAPLFFEVGIYGGGTQVQKTLYALDKDAVESIPDALFNNPEFIRKENYIKDKLDWSGWLKGETTYRDVAQDGMIEVLNISQAPYPEELKAKLKEKYGFINTDYISSFRKALSVYQWNDKKKQFDDLGDYYY